jgi:CelD/BcsL family acetyltransferase involved in cellulose biosynthesis
MGGLRPKKTGAAPAASALKAAGAMSLSEPAEVLFRAAAEAPPDVRSAAEPIALGVATDIEAVAAAWRQFETTADCTVFQTFAWQSAWLRTVGAHRRLRPAIVTGRDRSGALLFLMPFAVEGGLVRRLVWLAADFCDYNGPLLAADFAARVTPERFAALWREIVALLRHDARLSFDVALLDKLPETVGNQPNPFLALGGQLNANGAHLTRLGADWESFYRAKRSSATRRHDRSKLRHLAAFGEVRFVTPDDPAATLDTLFAQKARSLARMGIGNLFARPGVAGFFREIVDHPGSAGLAHVSRLDVGNAAAATNLGLVFRGRYYHVLTAYEGGELARFGPGAAHLHELMRYAIARGCRIFDFTVGDQDFKRNWCDRELKLYDLRLAVSPFGWPVAAVAAAAGWLKRLVKRTPALWRAFSAARVLAARLVRRDA